MLSTAERPGDMGAIVSLPHVGQLEQLVTRVVDGTGIRLRPIAETGSIPMPRAIDSAGANLTPSGPVP
jgi:hypothetical protein